MNVFNLNIDKLVTLLLPTQLRKSRMIHWLLCLVKPVKVLYTQFYQYRLNAIYKIEHTPQVYSMVNVFNDAFDNNLRRIRITDGIYINPVWFYEPEETKPVHFYEPIEDKPVYFFEPEELENLDVDFIILLPFGMHLNEAQTIRLKALCDFYRSPDKTYLIQYANE